MAMPTGFVLEPPGTVSEWLNVKAACQSFADELTEKATEKFKERDEAVKEATQQRKEEEAEHHKTIASVFGDLAKMCSGDEAVKVKIVSRKERNLWTEQGDKTLRDGLADIRGVDNPHGLKVGDDAFYEAMELSEIALGITTIISRYNHLDAKRRAGFFTLAPEL